MTVGMSTKMGRQDPQRRDREVGMLEDHFVDIEVTKD